MKMFENKWKWMQVKEFKKTVLIKIYHLVLCRSWNWFTCWTWPWPVSLSFAPYLLGHDGRSNNNKNHDGRSSNEKKRSDWFVCEIEANHQSRGSRLGVRLEIGSQFSSRINHQDESSQFSHFLLATVTWCQRINNEAARPEARQNSLLLDWIRWYTIRF